MSVWDCDGGGHLRDNKTGVKDSLKEIIAHKVICLPDAVDSRGPKGK